MIIGNTISFTLSAIALSKLCSFINELTKFSPILLIGSPDLLLKNEPKAEPRPDATYFSSATLAIVLAIPSTLSLENPNLFIKSLPACSLINPTISIVCLFSHKNIVDTISYHFKVDELTIYSVKSLGAYS